MPRLVVSVVAGFGLIVLFRMLDRRGIVRPHGSALGVPYDFRLPTVERLKQTYWNPEDRRVVVPKAFGVGFDVNFGALVRRVIGG